MHCAAPGGRHLVFVLTPMLALATACSLGLSFDGISGGQSGLDTGYGGRPPADAYAPIGDDSSDASDPNPSDGSTGDDGGSAIPTGFCATRSPQPTYCSDFESGLGSWSDQRLQNGSLAINSASSVSAPNALLSTTNTIPAGAGIGAIIRKNFAAFDRKPVHADYEFDMRIEQVDSAQRAVIHDFQLDGGSSYYEVQLIARPSGGAVQLVIAEYAETSSSNAYKEYALGVTVATNEWIHLRFDVVIKTLNGTANNSLRVYANGTQKLDTPLGVANHAGTPGVELGVGWVSTPSNPWKTRYDNLTVNTTAP